MANSICVQREMVSGDGSHVFWSLVTCFWDLVLGNMSSGVSFHVVWCLIFLCQVLCALCSFAQRLTRRTTSEGACASHGVRRMFAAYALHVRRHSLRLQNVWRCPVPNFLMTICMSRNVVRPKANTTSSRKNRATPSTTHSTTAASETRPRRLKGQHSLLECQRKRFLLKDLMFSCAW